MIVLHTNYGPITLELDAEKAPKTVENFLEYVNQGFYDNTIFHRVIDGFMIQGGGFEAGMVDKKTLKPIQNEAKTGLRNQVGTIAMARTSDPHSATAQFFINVADNGFLDHRAPTVDGWGYCAFGRVTEGMDIVQKIAKAKTTRRMGHDDVPVDDVIIEKVEVLANA
ncbi:peptidylprolyl isomerase [Candidatus Berkiella aquae]|uniref:Peptidyl-prolyl cis-trans isomerase n=1 Tax=Candidatus Berkiella aquae TaxID=295108 RepID=A0A0Q9YL12_9GAMM|nr:peptidylprolyl isomerase [Candidatus Berkiella aquae]MCS5710989.1 peptidyl-prolyl cis-trans isomerase [Candidatus Berkiella aquae]